MISIVICSRSASALEAVSQNVAATIGVPYELVAIDNSQGRYGICQAYNIGAAQAQYDLLCFMHEDLAFHTSNWGNIVANVLSDHSIGVLGVAGGMYQVKVPGGYWSPGPEYLRMQVLHSVSNASSILDIINPDGQLLSDVAVVDGLWMCSRKEVWQQYPFDEESFPGFHFYDIDYCTSIFSYFRVCVTFDILIEHYSKGSIGEEWLMNALKYQAKWVKRLPFGVISLSRFEEKLLERRALLEFIGRMLPTKLSNSLITKQLKNLLFNSPLNRESMGIIRRFLQQRYLNIR